MLGWRRWRYDELRAGAPKTTHRKDSMSIKLAFVDVETTGTQPEKHGIIQLGALICHYADGKLEDRDELTFDVAPFAEDEIEDEALAVSGITREQLGTFPAPAEVHRRFTEALARHCDRYNSKDKLVFAAYNAPFDARFLRRWFEKAGDKYYGSWFWHPPVDVMSLAMLYLAAQRPQMRDFKLVTVAETLGVPLLKAHTAIEDVRATRAIFEKIAPNLAGPV